MIRFEAFSWRFACADAPALRDVNLHVEPGRFVVVAGPSGSGKSTLALAMCGLLVGRQEGEAGGTVHVAGHDVATTPLHQTAQTIGLVQQNPETHFATLTVADEIAFGMENRCLSRDHIREHSAQAMELLSITHLADRSLATLSGGEKQRVAVASIVAGQPQVLVLDEPTASLDPEASRDLFHSLADLCRRTGLTVIIVEHKLAHLLPLKPGLIQVQDGRVAECSESSPLRLQQGDTQPRSRTCEASTPEELEPVVAVTGVTVKLGEHTALDDVSLRVAPGDVVALLGPNGGGKTTLLHALLGLVRPERGSIQVCGRDVARTPVSELARHVGLVFQNADHQLVADTVWGEALFASNNFKKTEAAQQGRAARMLNLIGLSDRRDDHPYRLSWGQKRRLNVVSSVLHQPRLLLLDEPFAGQDWENAALLLDVLSDVVDGNASSERGACVMVTHDPRIVQQSCSRIVFVEHGRVVVDAPLGRALEELERLGRSAYTPAPEPSPEEPA